MLEIARKRTKVVATIGPASRDPQMLRSLFVAGVNVVRLNFSHGTHAEHSAVIDDVRAITRDLGIHVAILQDLPGPKVRTGPLVDEAVQLKIGQRFALTTGSEAGTAQAVSVNYAGLANDVEIGKAIFLADGSIRLRIVSKDEGRIETDVELGGELRAKQGLNYPDGSLQIDALTDRDLDHLAFGIERGVDWVAVSFVRSAADITRVRAFMTERKVAIPIIAKIEKHEALTELDAILEAADGIMVARGDLGIEIPLEDVPLVQKDLIARANRISKPVITATQMLESMMVSARPTRAEANDVANAILDGTDAVMLSGETARGAYPLEAVLVMVKIAREVERAYPHTDLKERRLENMLLDVETSISGAAARVTEELGLAYIVTGTTTGNTAQWISSFRPQARIIAMTPLETVARRLAMVWGVEAMVVQSYRYIETLIEIAEAKMLESGLVRSGDLIAITSGMPVGAGGTNVLKIHTLP